MYKVVVFVVLCEKKFVRRLKGFATIESVMKVVHEVAKHVLCDFACLWCKGEVGCLFVYVFWVAEIHFEGVAPFSFFIKAEDEVTSKNTEIFNPAKLRVR